MLCSYLPCIIYIMMPAVLQLSPLNCMYNGVCCFFSDLLSEYRQLTKSLRQREADIRTLLDSHSQKGFQSPVRLDRSRRPATPAGKHGKIFDVNVESVKRKEKIQKVGGRGRMYCCFWLSFVSWTIDMAACFIKDIDVTEIWPNLGELVKSNIKTYANLLGQVR